MHWAGVSKTDVPRDLNNNWQAFVCLYLERFCIIDYCDLQSTIPAEVALSPAE